jgi:diketogulonate reductase-like aldo/keto reductase
MEKFKIPKIGLGTWALRSKTCTNSVLDAIELGYRHIDTAQMYQNEQNVGDAIETTSVPRNELVIATKIEPSNLSSARIHSSFRESLKKLKTDYVDILYVHWPSGRYNPKETLGTMDELVKEGLIRHIGISNFPIALVKEALSISENIIANQVEMHPGLRLKKLHEYNQSRNLYTVAYSPLAKGRILNNSILSSLATKHHISVPKVCIAYLSQRGAIPIPKSSSKEHLKENLDAVQISLDEEDINRIDTIPETRVVNFNTQIQWDVDN